MKKWEYFIFVQDPEFKDGSYQIVPSTKAWNEIGKEGWELVTAQVSNGGVAVAYFKRPLNNKNYEKKD